MLDLGCGSGDLTLELAARGADVTALDLSPGMVAVAGAMTGLDRFIYRRIPRARPYSFRMLVTRRT